MRWSRKITTWGNSLAIRLPSQLFRKTSLKEGDDIIIEVIDENTIQIKKEVEKITEAETR